jgi:hypothetical protein
MRKDKIHIPFKTRVRRWKGHVHIPFKILARWVSILFFTVVAGCFVYATVSAWKIAGSARVGCSYTVNPDVMAASYLQYNIKDQAIEPLFNGSLFISLGDVPSGPARVVVTTSGKKGIYGDTITVADFYHDEVANTIWMKAESTPVSFYRKSGSHRDFPFDSATINADTSFNPTVKLRFVTLRNANTSFYVPCGSTKVTSDASGSIRLSFEMRRNPLVVLVTVVIFGAATLFVCVIPFAGKLENLPTSVASFFFSIWSLRGILGSEMKVFPTTFDLGILSLCVLLILLIGIRLLSRWIKPQKPLPT